MPWNRSDPICNFSISGNQDYKKCMYYNMGSNIKFAGLILLFLYHFTFKAFAIRANPISLQLPCHLVPKRLPVNTADTAKILPVH
mmetsp:Transcript_59186/g.123624  ORF Transcript_59186/g.123624 Transcript_59186/m.123624 type:complete len:85 (+) Transcript_59186:351-605(+)